MSNEIVDLEVEKEDARLDRFLASSIPALSRAQAQRLIKEGLVQAGGLPLKASTLLPVGTKLTVTLPASSAVLLPEKENIPLDILFEDDQLLAINKPPGLVIHPSVGHQQGTLVNALLYHYPDMAALDGPRPGIVHRLDKETSGVLVVARSTLALQALQAQFKNRQTRKLYQALVHGMPDAPSGIIDVPIGRHPQHRQRMAALAEGKSARTRYKVLQPYTNYSLLQLSLETGRTHQIRVHLAWLGHPIVSDVIYGRRKRFDSLDRQFLHASELTILHPLTQQPLTFAAPLPPDLQVVLDAFKGPRSGG